MIEVNKNADLYRTNDELYDATYYQNYNGVDYGRNPKWIEFFDLISEKIVTEINPGSVLDIGCAYGLLVEKLRDRGCDAWGIDVSDYALSRARSDIIQYLSVDTLLRPRKRKFDLIVSIEVIEHIEEMDCHLAIKNMCEAADRVLIATTPDDFDDPTHFNVQPPIYWIEKFAEFGFMPDITHDAGYLTPYAILFTKQGPKLPVEVLKLYGEKKLQDYEFAGLKHQSNMLQRHQIENRAKIEQQAASIAEKEKIILDSANHVNNLEDTIAIERAARENLQFLFDKRTRSFSWKIIKPIRLLERAVKFFTPIFPVVFSTSHGEKLEFSPIDVGDLGWAKVEALGATSSQFQLSFHGLSADTTLSFPALKLPTSEKGAMWLIRVDPQVQKYSLSIVRGNPEKLSVFRVSSAKAWKEIFLDRWRRGKGFKAAVALVLAFIKTTYRNGLGTALNGFWFSDKRLVGSYDEWLLRYDQDFEDEKVKYFIGQLLTKPMISIIMPTFDSDINNLQKAIDSVFNQSYENWELCIADDASSNPDLIRFLKKISSRDKVKVLFRPKNGHISAASNSALELVTGDFITFLDHDDLLHRHALATIVAYINSSPATDIFYSDEDKVDVSGNRFEPHFKPEWSPELLLSQNYICHMSVYRRAIIESLGGFKEGVEGAQDYDLILRATEVTENITRIPHVLYHWRATKGSTALSQDQKDYANKKSVDVLKNALLRRNLDAKVLETGLGVYHRVQYNLSSPPPSVSIIIPTRNRVDLLKVCVEGITEKTDYPNLEIIVVDNNSDEVETQNYLAALKQTGVYVFEYDGDFNFSAINNFAVSKASGEILILLNNDIEVISPDWLTELVSHAMRPGVGVVGCRLYYPDDHVQHDGIIVGIGGVAGYAHPRLERSLSGDFGRSKLIRNYSAVTAAALAIKKSIYNEVGGLDEQNLAVAFNDVDFCLKVKKAGYRNIYTPYSELYHHESVSRGLDITPEKAARFEKEARFMQQKWRAEIENDPFYNPNLSLRHGYSLDMNRGGKWPWDIN